MIKKQEPHFLREYVGELVELNIRFPGGSVTLTGRVDLVLGDRRNFLVVGTAHLPLEAMVRPEYMGNSLVFNV